MELKLINVSYDYKQGNILKNIEWEFNKSKFYGIVGPNGSGKTTLLKLIAQLLKVEQGTIQLFGKDITNYKEKERARRVAFVPQILDMTFAFSVEEIVSMGRYPYMDSFGELNETDKSIIEKALKKTELLSLKERKVNTLSGGELQRVILARAIAQQTDILLLDEPISHLDIHHQLGILKMIKSLCESQDLTAICVMHDLNLTMKFCENVIMLKDGEVFSAGATKEVLNKGNIKDVYGIDVEIAEINKRLQIIY